jgi:hypothetical protein
VTGGKFSWRSTKDGRLRISRDGKVVSTLAGESARRLLARVDGADEAAAQALMARATGNYRRGNERPKPER